MFASSMFVASMLMSGAAAQGGGAAVVNQLETARLTQAAQRVEFGVEGEKSAFKFSFSDPVCFTVPLCRSPPLCCDKLLIITTGQVSRRMQW